MVQLDTRCHTLCSFVTCVTLGGAVSSSLIDHGHSGCFSMKSGRFPCFPPSFRPVQDGDLGLECSLWLRTVGAKSSFRVFFFFFNESGCFLAEVLDGGRHLTRSGGSFSSHNWKTGVVLAPRR